MSVAISEPLVALTVFLVGVALVIGSVETFVESVTEGAVGLGVSAFFLTVLLAGTDFENAILGLAAVLGDLPGLALGTVFGEALFVLGVGVGIAGLLAPFEPAVPWSYLSLAALSPALLVVLAADGILSRLDGAVLTLAFLPLLAGVFVLERRADTRYLSAEELAELDDFAEEEENRNEGKNEDEKANGDEGKNEEEKANGDEGKNEEENRERGGLVAVAIVGLAVAGMTAGSELAVRGARELLAVFGLTGLAFGATVMSFVASIEELFLTVEPVRQGRPHLGVGNVVGSVLFFVTANAGVIALVTPIDTGGTVVTVHWPFFLGALALVIAMFARGRIGRPEGVLLLAVYAAYWGTVLLA